LVPFATSFDFYNIIGRVNPCEDEVRIHTDPILIQLKSEEDAQDAIPKLEA
jgi:hypothetical protein